LEKIQFGKKPKKRRLNRMLEMDCLLLCKCARLLLDEEDGLGEWEAMFLYSRAVGVFGL
jgi:hypothetical protein